MNSRVLYTNQFVDVSPEMSKSFHANVMAWRGVSKLHGSGMFQIEDQVIGNCRWWATLIPDAPPTPTLGNVRAVRAILAATLCGAARVVGIPVPAGGQVSVATKRGDGIYGQVLSPGRRVGLGGVACAHRGVVVRITERKKTPRSKQPYNRANVVFYLLGERQQDGHQ